MKKKILIIEGDRDALCFMVRTLLSLKHEVKAILFAPGAVADQNFAATQDTEQVIRLAGSFEPDMVFIDHDFRLGPGVSGAYLAHRLELPRQKLVGTSSLNEQPYCATKIFGKVGVSMQNTGFQRQFKALIAA